MVVFTFLTRKSPHSYSSAGLMLHVLPLLVSKLTRVFMHLLHGEDVIITMTRIWSTRIQAHRSLFLIYSQCSGTHTYWGPCKLCTAGVKCPALPPIQLIAHLCSPAWLVSFLLATPALCCPSPAPPDLHALYPKPHLIFYASLSELPFLKSCLYLPQLMCLSFLSTFSDHPI